MFNPTITITGGNCADNAQLCSTVQAALQRAGFSNVSIDPASTPQEQYDVDVITAMRNLNPDLFDTPLYIEGVCESDAIIDYSTLSNSESFVQSPEVWPGAWPSWQGAGAQSTPMGQGYAPQWPSLGSVGNFFSGLFGQEQQTSY